VLFNSYEFIFVFLPISLFIYFYLNHKRLTNLSKIWLVFASLFFYSWWNITYLPLILTSVLFNYAIANAMANNDKFKNTISKKTLFQIGLIFNIGLLAYFKYADFFISNTNSLINTNIALLGLALPLAISFFTLQQIAFLSDSYEGLAKEKNFLDYAVFVTFFPQLITGPIVYHKEMMPQFASIRSKIINYKNIAIGFTIFSFGLFKKVVLADGVAAYATPVFNEAETSNMLSLFEAWGGSLAYTFQLYFDFSGYTDMAIGAALLFNIRLPINFNSPLKSYGIIEFWQRWHITLSHFITAYIYTPIVRSFNQLTFHKAMFVTLITFFIAGLWHGASWMFVIFGTLHGLGLVINQYWRKTKIKINKPLAWFITFNFVNITLIFFRAESIDGAENILSGMAGLQGIVLPETYLPYFNNILNIGDYLVTIGWQFENPEFFYGMKGVVFLTILLLIAIMMPNVQQIMNHYHPTLESYHGEIKDINFRWLKWRPTLTWAIFTTSIFIASIFILSIFGKAEFLYFKF